MGLYEIFYKNKKITLFCCGVLIVLCILAVFGLLFAPVQQKTKTKKTVFQTIDENFNPQADILPPSYAGFQDEYQYSRQTKQNWTQQEAQQYFHPIQDSDIKKLRAANQKLVDNIFEAAP